MTNPRLPIALAVLRYSIAAFFAVWAIEKFVKPEVTGRIWSHFYKIEGIGEIASYAIGSVQLAVIVLFVLGLFRFWTYGALMVMHAVSTFSTWEHLIDPYGKNHLFWAGVPTLAAIVALWLMREEDTLGTLGNR
ncbi:MAG: hypothetical protein AAFR11_04190 [Pseudomonadota bacterium]